MSDMRNNTIRDMENNIYVLDVEYRQTHHFNTTYLHYTIEDDDSDMVDINI